MKKRLFLTGKQNEKQVQFDITYGHLSSASKNIVSSDKNFQLGWLRWLQILLI